MKQYQGIKVKLDTLNETASAGATSAGSIAVDMSGTSKDKNNKYSLKSFMDSWQKKVKNLYVPYTISVNESFDLESVFSRLSGMERKSLDKNQSMGTTFGIEDDNGNLMKVTVDRSQADAFEDEVANYLADIKKTANNFPSPEKERSVSMAELLFNLKGKFNIIDVDFPEIPKDVVYNIKDATAASDVGDEVGTEDNIEGEFGDNEFGDSEDPSAPLDLTDYEDTETGIPTDEEDVEDEDLDISSEFPEEVPDSEGSILTKVIDMLKSQAESEIERAKAEAEKAKAEQARYTAQATQTALRDQEERLKYEIELEQEKKKEKEARLMADMAKHKISKTLAVTEADEGATPASVMRQRQQIGLRFRIEADDSPETRQYKTKQKAEAMREWMSRYRQALNADRHQKQMKQKEREEQQKIDQQKSDLDKQQGDANQQNPNTSGLNNEI